MFILANLGIKIVLRGLKINKIFFEGLNLLNKQRDLLHSVVLWLDITASALAAVRTDLQNLQKHNK